MANKKIMIVTVYNSENCGSFLQAYAMKVALERFGYGVAFYKRDVEGTSHAFGPHIKLTLKRLLRGHMKAVKFTIGPWFAFNKAVKELRVCDEKSAFYRETETVLLGSDTIWNFKDLYFRSKADVFLGKFFQDKRVISYAASAGNTEQEAFQEVLRCHGGLGHIAKLLVRDEHTKGLVEAETGQESQIVCDPTFLVEKNDYLKLVPDASIDYRYVLLYYFGEIPEEVKTGIQEFAARHSLKIVSLLKDRKWCDYSIPADPKKMVQYFSSASAVVTNTFHGCAFSMIFERPFAAHDVGKIKVKDLLEKLGEADRLFVDKKGLVDALERYCEVITSGRLEAYRKESLEILRDALRVE